MTKHNSRLLLLMSSSSFHRRFKREAGIAFSQELNRERGVNGRIMYKRLREARQFELVFREIAGLIQTSFRVIITRRTVEHEFNLIPILSGLTIPSIASLDAETVLVAVAW